MMANGPVAQTLPDRYAVLGHPVQHSQSPFIHGEFARQTGQALAYGRHECPLGGFEPALRAWAADARDGPARGCNVTVPFKFDAFRLAGHATERARLAGAANTLRLHGPEPAQWEADNTDGIGLMRDLRVNAGEPLRGRRVLLLGAGGAAAGVLGPLLAEQPAQVRVGNRTADKAQALVATHAAVAAQHGVAIAAGGLGDVDAGFDIVLNASAASLAGAAVLLPPQALAAGALVVDLMYGAAAEPFLAWARTHGARTRDGLGMLVEQAAFAFAWWRGVQPQTAPVLAALRQRLAALRPRLTGNPAA